jgi:GT2 family glycosyltransferase
MSALDSDACESAGAPPLVSLTIVTRNRVDELRAALNAIRGQSYTRTETIIVDNASEDETAAMVEQEYPTVRLIRLHRNTGCQPGRNMAMANCRGQIIFNLDDDGVLAPDAVEQMVRVFDAHPEVGLVAACVQIAEEKSGEVANFNRERQSRYTAFFIGAAHALRREVLRDAGYFPEYVRGHSEVDLGLRIINSGWEMWFAPQVVMHHALSAKERDENLHARYHIRHQLETAARLQPALTAISQIAWRILLGLVLAFRRGILRGYMRGVLEFTVSLPRVLRDRTPISLWASRKFQYLNTHTVTRLDELPDFNEASFWDVVRWRGRRTFTGKRRSAPDVDGA